MPHLCSVGTRYETDMALLETHHNKLPNIYLGVTRQCPFFNCFVNHDFFFHLDKIHESNWNKQPNKNLKQIDCCGLISKCFRSCKHVYADGDENLVNGRFSFWAHSPWISTNCGFCLSSMIARERFFLLKKGKKKLCHHAFDE